MVRLTRQLFLIYRFIKSGMLFDFLIKRFFISIASLCYKIFSVDFCEKYIIENIFFRTHIFSKYLKQFFNFISNNFTNITLPCFFLLINISLFLCFQ